MDNYIFPEKKRVKQSRFSRIIASAVYLPEKIVTNGDIIEKNNLPFKEAILEKSLGIKERRIADDGLADSDLLAAAARRCLDKAGVDVNKLSRLIVTKFIGDYQFPMTASMVQRKLGSKTAFQAFDMEGGTSSFLQAMDLADKFISSGDEYILLVSGGIMNKFVNATDPRTAFLFGDGAAALLLGRAEEEHFTDSYFYSNYDYYDFAKGYALTELAVDVINRQKTEALFDCYTMGNWKDIIGFYEEATCRIIEKVLSENRLTPEDIDFFLVTETNKQVAEAICRQLGCQNGRRVSLLETRGNTMSAMLPMLYNDLDEKGLLKPDTTLLFISHGEGASGGAILYKVKGG